MAKNRDILPIGIDIGSACIKILQLQQRSEGYTFHAAARMDLPMHLREDTEGRMTYIGRRLGDLLKQSNFDGKHCIISLPASDAFIRHVKIPRLDEHGTEVAVRRSVQKDLPCPVEETEVRFQLASEIYADGETRQEMIVAVCPHETLNMHLKLLDRVGLEVHGVYLAPFALAECYSSLFEWGEDSSSTVLYVDMGAENIQAVIAHGPEVVFARSLAGGVRLLDETIAQAMDSSRAEAWQLRQKIRQNEMTNISADQLSQMASPWVADSVEEIQTCLRYYASVFRNMTGVERVIFCGGLADDKRLCQAIARQLNLPAQVGNPFAGLLESNKPIPDYPAGMSVAMGLSLLGRSVKEEPKSVTSASETPAESTEEIVSPIDDIPMAAPAEEGGDDE